MTEEESLLEFRAEYEKSKQSVFVFAQQRGEDREKVKYKLRKALQIRKRNSGIPKLKFTKLEHQPFIPKSSDRVIKITTSYGSIIEIPI
ncbi:MAG: hypothetical protein AB8F74_14905 [Saprospiraceae bacterium]